MYYSSCVSWKRIAVLSFLAAFTQADDTGFDALNYVDPLIGTINGGHVFAGATLPFGMAKAVADVDNPDEMQGGFASDDSFITGFSHMHDSGTGGSSSLGNFPLFPQVGCPGDSWKNCVFSGDARKTKRVNGSAVARPGYFSITLDTLIRAEMTVTNHTTLTRFTFPQNTTAASPNGTSLVSSPLILLELTDLQQSRTEGHVSVDNSTGRIVGNGTFSPSFGEGYYTLHFCADFQGKIRDSGIFTSLMGPNDASNWTMTRHKRETLPPPAGGFVQFEPSENNQIMARVGLSFISVKQACQNAEKEIPTFDFDATRRAGEDAWRKKLNVISIDATGVSDELQTVFWSGTYRSMISPQDYTGENPLWKSSEPYYDSYYCIWDSFRSIHPLLTILDPHSQTLMVRSLIDIYRHEGKLPDCRMSLCKGWTQGGSNADVVLADAFLKGISEGVDWVTGYAAVVSDAEIEPRDWNVEGRGDLLSWKTRGYIPIDDYDPYGTGTRTRSISRSVEYAYDDFVIALMAQKLGKIADAEKYLLRSKNWRNLYNPSQNSFIPGTKGLLDTGFKGFLQPRFLDGRFAYQDPALCSPIVNFTACYLNDDGHETYEGSSWLYTFYVPQDMASLITTLGGADRFISRLTYLHTSGLLYIGDEQAFLPVFQFHYGGRPGLSAKFSHFYIPTQFNSSLNGIAGNDDSGAMGSFTTFSMMGMWPISGQNVYLITPPYFPSISITSPLTGKTATIRNVGFDAGYQNIYIQNATLNGKPWTKSWITHSFWLEGGVLELTLGSKESKWGTRKEDLPPSSSTRWADFYSTNEASV